MINLKVEKRKGWRRMSSKKAIKEDKKVPAIIYGGDKEPMPVFLQNNELIKIISSENVFGSVIEIDIDNKKRNGSFQGSRNIHLKIFLLMLIS